MTPQDLPEGNLLRAGVEAHQAAGHPGEFAGCDDPGCAGTRSAWLASRATVTLDPWDGSGLPRGAPVPDGVEAERAKNAARSRRHYRRTREAQGKTPGTYRKPSPPNVGGPSR